jgi:hypothetical protein
MDNACRRIGLLLVTHAPQACCVATPLLDAPAAGSGSFVDVLESGTARTIDARHVVRALTFPDRTPTVREGIYTTYSINPSLRSSAINPASL